jgi:hypothetical protein
MDSEEYPPIKIGERKTYPGIAKPYQNIFHGYDCEQEIAAILAKEENGNH